MRKVSAIILVALLGIAAHSAHASWKQVALRANKALPANGIARDTRDGTVYKTIRIGTQIWMAENLNYGKTVSNMEQKNNGIAEKSHYLNKPENGKKYGALYTWGEAMNYTKKTSGQIQGICPSGWHLPSDAEWDELMRHLDPSVKNAFTGWSGTRIFQKLNDPNGFNLSLGGNSVSGWYFYQDQMAYFWSSTRFSEASAFYRSVDRRSEGQFRGTGDVLLGMCVRCLKNEE